MILFFDTETTGLPKNRNAPSTDTDNWPRVVQLAWILTDFDGNQISEKCFIIKPEGYEISRGATNIHGFTTQYALENGHSMLDVLEDFANDVKKAEMIAAHNLDFDKNVISAEFHRCGYGDLIDNLHGVCTMKDSTEFCALPGNKWPNLFELHLKLFEQDFKGAHDALTDIRATSKCFWELNRLGVIKFQSTNQLLDESINTDQDDRSIKMEFNKIAYARCAFRHKYDESIIFVQYCQYKKSTNSSYVVHGKYDEDTFNDYFGHLNIESKDIVNKYVNKENEISYFELNIDLLKVFDEILYINRIETNDHNKVLDENRKIIQPWNLKKGKDGRPSTCNKKLVYYKHEFGDEDRDLLLPCDNEAAVDMYPKPESVDQLMQLIKSSKNLELNGWELEGQYLNWASLTGADLQNANLSNTQLYRANLNRACLCEAKLIGANLVMADLVGAELAYADLSGADLSGADLFGSDLSNVNLSNARLCNANLLNAKMENTNLQNADLRGANLSGVKIKNSNLKGAKLKKANLTGASILESDLSAVIFSHADLTGANLESCNLTNAIVEGTILKSTNLRGSNIEKIRFSNGDIETAFRKSNSV